MDRNSLLSAAEGALKALDPRAAVPAAWKSDPFDGALLLGILRVLEEARARSLQEISRADAVIAMLLEALDPLLAAGQAPPPEAAPAAPRPVPGLEIVPAAPEAAEKPEAAPAAPPGSPADAVLAGLEALLPPAKDLPIDPADFAFVSKSREMAAELSPADVDQEAKILYSCVWQIEGLADRYGRGASAPGLGSAYGRFLETLTSRKETLAARLAEIGYRLFPQEAAGALSDLKAAVGEDAVAANAVYSDRKAGTIVGVRRSGVRTERGLVEKAQVLVSQGPHEAAAAIEGAALGLLALRVPDPRERALAGRALKEVHKLLASLASQPDGYTFARFAVNALSEVDAGGRLKDAIRRLVAYLEKGGFQEIVVPVGETFNDSFSPGKYERKRVPSDKPKDKIVGVVQRGFLDSKGVCIQKAVVAVSKG